MTCRTEFTDCLFRLLILIFILEKELQFKITWPHTHLVKELKRHIEQMDKRLCYSQPLCLLPRVNEDLLVVYLRDLVHSEHRGRSRWARVSFCSGFPHVHILLPIWGVSLPAREPFPSQPWWAVSGDSRAVWKCSCLPAECQGGTNIAGEGAAAGSARVIAASSFPQVCAAPCWMGELCFTPWEITGVKQGPGKEQRGSGGFFHTAVDAHSSAQPQTR